MYIYICKYTNTHIHTYIYIYIHTYVHESYIYIWNQKTLAQNEYHIYPQIPLHTHD